MSLNTFWYERKRQSKSAHKKTHWMISEYIHVDRATRSYIAKHSSVHGVAACLVAAECPSDWYVQWKSWHRDWKQTQIQWIQSLTCTKCLLLMKAQFKKYTDDY